MDDKVASALADILKEAGPFKRPRMTKKRRLQYTLESLKAASVNMERCVSYTRDEEEKEDFHAILACINRRLLGMPLRKGMSMQSAMHDLKHGPHHKDRTHKQEVAIALKYAGRKKKKRTTRRRR